MNWFTALFSPSPRPSVPANVTAEISPGIAPTEHAHLALLSKFRHVADPAYVAHAGWERALGMPTLEVIRRFVAAGWLVPADTATKMDRHFRATDLRDLLKARGCKVSGTKVDQIKRLLEFDPDGMRQAVASVESLACSPTVLEAVDRYLQDQDAAESNMKRAACDALSRQDFASAVRAVVAYDRTQLFPRGLGIDTTSPGRDAHLLEEVQRVYEAKPPLLSTVPEASMASFRLAAAMLVLTGDSRATDYLPDGISGHPRLDHDTVTRMLIFSAHHARDLELFRQTGVRSVAIDVVPDACPACLKHDGKRFRLESAPALPHSECTNPMGCRCGYLADD